VFAMERVGGPFNMLSFGGEFANSRARTQAECWGKGGRMAIRVVSKNTHRSQKVLCSRPRPSAAEARGNLL
jgi:hypothetical protein